MYVLLTLVVAYPSHVITVDSGRLVLLLNGFVSAVVVYVRVLT